MTCAVTLSSDSQTPSSRTELFTRQITAKTAGWNQLMLAEVKTPDSMISGHMPLASFSVSFGIKPRRAGLIDLSAPSALYRLDFFFFFFAYSHSIYSELFSCNNPAPQKLLIAALCCKLNCPRKSEWKGRHLNKLLNKRAWYEIRYEIGTFKVSMPRSELGLHFAETAWPAGKSGRTSIMQ